MMATLNKHYRYPTRNLFSFTFFGEELVNNLMAAKEAVMNKKDEYKKFVIYGGHDLNIILFLKLMDLVSYDCNKNLFTEN